jgi:hypothetical protein
MTARHSQKFFLISPKPSSHLVEIEHNFAFQAVNESGPMPDKEKLFMAQPQKKTPASINDSHSR